MLIEHHTVYLAVLSTENVQHTIEQAGWVRRKGGILQLNGLCRPQCAKWLEGGPQHFRNKCKGILLL